MKSILFLFCILIGSCALPTYQLTSEEIQDYCYGPYTLCKADCELKDTWCHLQCEDQYRFCLMSESGKER